MGNNEKLVLVIEDDDDDYAIVRASLISAAESFSPPLDISFVHVRTYHEAISCLDQDVHFALIVADVFLPPFGSETGVDVISHAIDTNVDAQKILISGKNMLEAGESDFRKIVSQQIKYIPKNRIQLRDLQTLLAA